MPSIVLFIVSLQSNYDDLKDPNPIIRRNTATILRLKKDMRAVPHLIECLNDTVKEVRDECYSALLETTGKTDIPLDYKAWDSWYRLTSTNVTEPQKLPADIEQAYSDIKDSRDRIKRLMLYMSGAAIVFVIIFAFSILFFTAYVSSKLKEWREIVKKADFYINECNVISVKVNGILTDLDKKRIEITSAILELKKETQDELERYMELLQKNLDHKIKTEITSAKQAAEVEIEHTVNETKKLFEDRFQTFQNLTQNKFRELVTEIEYYSMLIKAEIAENNGEFEAALKLYEKLSDLKPTERIVWIKAGELLTKHNKLDEAILHYENAANKLKEESLFHYKLASLYAVRQDRDNMLRHLSLLRKKNGEFDKVLKDRNFSSYLHDPEFRNIAGLS